MTATRRGRGAAASTSASSSSSSSFTPLTDLVPASIPYTDQARATLEALRRGQDPGLQALLRALNCARACEAAGAPYASRCLCRSFASASASSSSSASASVAPRGAGGGAAPRCVRGLAPPPGSYRKVGLWAKPPKSDEKAGEEEAKEEEGKEGEEVRRREREREQFFFLSFDFFREAKITKKKTVQKACKEQGSNLENIRIFQNHMIQGKGV